VNIQELMVALNSQVKKGIESGKVYTELFMKFKNLSWLFWLLKLHIVVKSIKAANQRINLAT
jgi:hypothetical protein